MKQLEGKGKTDESRIRVDVGPIDGFNTEYEHFPLALTTLIGLASSMSVRGWKIVRLETAGELEGNEEGD